MRTVWVCEKCDQYYDNEEDAKICESNHIKIDELKIVEIKFEEGRDPLCPDSVIIGRENEECVYRYTYKLSNKIMKDKITGVTGKVSY
jgi:hypothetical protein